MRHLLNTNDDTVSPSWILPSLPRHRPKLGQSGSCPDGRIPKTSPHRTSAPWLECCMVWILHDFVRAYGPTIGVCEPFQILWIWTSDSIPICPDPVDAVVQLNLSEPSCRCFGMFSVSFCEKAMWKRGYVTLLPSTTWPTSYWCNANTHSVEDTQKVESERECMTLTQREHSIRYSLLVWWWVWCQ